MFKIGMHYRSPNGNWGIGLNITTPNLHIYGEADVKKEYYRNNVFNNEAGIFTQDLAFAGLQQDVSINIKDPFSIAFGVRYKTPNRKNSIQFTTEYFFEIPEYALLKTTDSKILGNLQPEYIAETMNFCSSANSVWNVGFGFVQYIDDRLTINGGIKTDFNTLTGQKQKTSEDFGESPRLSNLYFDKFHVIAGPRLDVKRFGFVLGIQYSWGREDNMYNMTNLSEAVEYNPEINQALQGGVSGRKI